jgi:hypothetical protein
VLNADNQAGMTSIHHSVFSAQYSALVRLDSNGSGPNGRDSPRYHNTLQPYVLRQIGFVFSTTGLTQSRKDAEKETALCLETNPAVLSVFAPLRETRCCRVGSNKLGSFFQIAVPATA